MQFEVSAKLTVSIGIQFIKFTPTNADIIGLFSNLHESEARFDKPWPLWPQCIVIKAIKAYVSYPDFYHIAIVEIWISLGFQDTGY